MDPPAQWLRHPRIRRCEDINLFYNFYQLLVRLVYFKALITHCVWLGMGTCIECVLYSLAQNSKSSLLSFLSQYIRSHHQCNIFVPESVWKVHRKLLNPSFNQQVLNTFVNEMNVQARSLVSRVAPKVGKGPFDVRKFCISYTLSTVTSKYSSDRPCRK